MEDIVYRTITLTVFGVALASSTDLYPLLALADDGQYVASVTSDSNPPQVYFQARQGDDYVLHAYGYGQTAVSIINPNGQLSPVLHPTNGSLAAVEFRAAYTASYGIDAQAISADQYGDRYAAGAVSTDCRGDAQTTCRLTPARGLKGVMQTPADRDWYRVTMKRGLRYRVALNAENSQVALTLRNPRGGLIQKQLNSTNGGTAFVIYKATATGTYFACASVVTSSADYDISIQRF